ncbi:iron-containing alcohol dehydrogenase [Tenuifilaceae bacterium CYCD]|nr:iron-containing alcohol dehydrogenase [Tenuifilaceae bacterium CYCD]
MKISEDIRLELRKFVAPEYIFGIDARKMAANYCKKLGAERVFIATDKNLRKSQWFIELENSLQTARIESVVFDNISPNPRDYEVIEGAENYNQNKCNIIIAIGGGSVMDCAKGIGIVVTNNKHIHYFEGIDKIEKPTPPLICIPTTAGTSADVSQFAIINNTTDKYKMAIISKALVPDVALIDPFVLQSMDNYLTACTGMDALCHAFEAFVSNANSAFTDLFALEAIRLLHENLIINIQSPNNIQARGKTMLGSLYAGLAFSNASLGCVHSMAHSLGGYLDLPHGECNAILLPHVVDFNYKSAIERYRKIAETLEISTSGSTESDVKKTLINYLFNLKKNLDITHSLKDKNVTTDIIPSLAKKAIKDPCNATNPKAPHVKDLELIYNEAL